MITSITVTLSQRIVIELLALYSKKLHTRPDDSDSTHPLQYYQNYTKLYYFLILLFISGMKPYYKERKNSMQMVFQI